MMISPETYAEELKNEPLERLIKERNNLLKEIIHFEKSRKKSSDAEVVCPSPETQYYWNMHYLVEVSKLIINKYDEDEKE